MNQSSLIINLLCAANIFKYLALKNLMNDKQAKPVKKYTQYKNGGRNVRLK